MKKRMLMLFVSLFALTPAILGSAWGGENRSKSGSKQECELLEGKRIETTRPASQPIVRPVRAGGQKQAS